MYNYPGDYPQQGQQLTKQPYYLTVVHTMERLLIVLSDHLRNIQGRTGKWFQRKTLDHQYQRQQDKERSNCAINIGKYMEIRTTYRNNIRDVIQDKPDYKQSHSHDYSVITTNKYVDEKYARHMIIDIYGQYNKKEEQQRQGITQSNNQPPNQPPHQNRFIMFMIQHHATKITKIMKDAGVPQQQINLAFGHFDEKAAQHFTNPNIRNLADMNEGLQPMRETRRVIQEAQRIAETGQESLSEDDEDDFDYDASHATTTRATDSTKKRTIKGQAKITAPRPRTKTVQNIFNARINNFHATPIPMDDAEGEDTRATPRLPRHHVLKLNYYVFGNYEDR
eukprot:5301918-Amphidinium_carterae.1